MEGNGEGSSNRTIISQTTKLRGHSVHSKNVIVEPNRKVEEVANSGTSFTDGESFRNFASELGEAKKIQYEFRKNQKR